MIFPQVCGALTEWKILRSKGTDETFKCRETPSMHFTTEFCVKKIGYFFFKTSREWISAYANGWLGQETEGWRDGFWFVIVWKSLKHADI